MKGKQAPATVPIAVIYGGKFPTMDSVSSSCRLHPLERRLSFSSHLETCGSKLAHHDGIRKYLPRTSEQYDVGIIIWRMSFDFQGGAHSLKRTGLSYISTPTNLKPKVRLLDQLYHRNILRRVIHIESLSLCISFARSDPVRRHDDPFR